jgi:O-antigen ligase
MLNKLTTRCPPGMRATTRRLRWGAAPLLLAVFLQAMPLNLEARTPVEMSIEEREELVLSSVTEGRSGNRYIPIVVWALLYAMAAWALVRENRASLPRFEARPSRESCSLPPSPLTIPGRRQAPRVRNEPVKLARVGRPTARMRFGRSVTRPGTPSVLFLLICSQLVIAAASVIWSAYPLRVAACVSHLTGRALIALAAAHHYRSDLSSAVRHLGYALGANVALSVVAAALFPAVAVDFEGRWAGLTGHPNFLGNIAWCAMWANLVAIRGQGRLRALLHLCLVGIAGFALLQAQSKTSLVVAMLMVVLVGLLTILERFDLLKPAFAFPVVLASGALVVPVLALPDLAWGEFTRLLGRSPDMTGRQEIWQVAIALILQRPILGWGFDYHATVIDLTHFRFHHFHNAYLDVMVRGGVVTLAAVLAMLVVAVRNIAHAGQRRFATAPVLLYPFLAAVVVHSFSEVDFLAPQDGIWILVLFVCFWSEVSSKSVALPHRPLQPLIQKNWMRATGRPRGASPRKLDDPWQVRR